MKPTPALTRRRVLHWALGGAALTAAAVPVRAAAAATGGERERWLELANTHTGETVQLAYRDRHGLIASALARLEHLLRDHRVNEQHPIDPALYDQLTDLAVAAGCDARYEVISGYRSARTNAVLAAESPGVARHSLHIAGRAIDVRLSGCATARLHDLALAAARGGVGFYRRSDFVHLDTGRVRTWSG